MEGRFKKKIDRREFIKKSAKITAAIYSTIKFPLNIISPSFSEDFPTLVIAKNSTPADLLMNALEIFGGMKSFVKRGDKVVVKPNYSFDNPPEYASTTHPQLVYEVISLSYEAGARRVLVVDRPCYAQHRCLERSGIRKAVEEAGGEIVYLNKRKYVLVKIKEGRDLKKIRVYKEILDCDCLINMPIAKHHAITGLTLGMKNWMGVIGGNRGKLIHPNIHQKLADLSTLLKPNLVIMDATRILLRNGPSGGDLKDVKRMDTIVVGVDQVAVDSYTTSFFGMKGEDIGYIKNAYLMGLGEIEISKMNLVEIDLKERKRYLENT
jgi:uncharacterized protein (DUF362 family)